MCNQPWPWARRWSPAATSARASVSWARGAAWNEGSCPRPASRSPSFPGGASSVASRSRTPAPWAVCSSRALWPSGCWFGAGRACVVTVGGYAGLPCAVAAIMLRVPLVVVSYDAVPGASNRLVARFARKCAVAFEGTGLPHEVVTGAPLREAVLRADRSPEGRLRGPRGHRRARRTLPSCRRGRLARRPPPERGGFAAGQELGLARRRHDLPRRRGAEPRRHGVAGSRARSRAFEPDRARARLPPRRIRIEDAGPPRRV